MRKAFTALNPLDYHVLLALAAHPLHGYAICQAVESESGGSVAPRAGSLYRVIGRLMRGGLVKEVVRPPTLETHPGLTRKYYGLTERGVRAMKAEVERRRWTTALAEQRLGLVDGDRS